MYNGNALKIGLFGANCSSARTATKVPERWSASWPDCLKLARMADDAGIDFMLPIGRWKGYGGDTDFHGTTLETVTWACGLLGATKRITVFGTVHAPLFHPLIAAKEFVTADHIGEGRFGLNIVAGWNEGEFEMFGVEQREHDDALRIRPGVARRHQARLDRGRRSSISTAATSSSRACARSPKPYGGTRPLIMNAGSLRRRPGVRAAQLRRVLHRHRRRAAAAAGTAQQCGERDRSDREEGRRSRPRRKLGRDIEVYTIGQVICRPTQKEAEDYYRHANIDNADWGAVERMMALRNITRAEHAAGRIRSQSAVLRRQRDRRLSVRRHARQGRGGAGQRQPRRACAASRCRSSIISTRCRIFRDEVLPRLVRMGVRERR